MRKFKIIVFALVASAIASCVKESGDSISEPAAYRLTAIIEAAETKTYLSAAGNDVYRVYWSDGDAIGVFTDDNQGMDRFTLAEGAGTKKATFTGYGTGSAYYAYYPVSGVLSRSGNNSIQVELPSHQIHSNKYANGIFPMVAFSNSDNLTFKNVASVIKIPITGYHYVDSIVFRPNNQELAVSGKATVNTIDASITMQSGANNNVVLVTSGVGLNLSNATDFYIVLPPGKYDGGFSIRIHSSTGYMDKSYNQDFTFERSRIHETAPVEFKPEGGLDISKYLEGHGVKNDPFLVKSVEDLLLVQAAVNASGNISTEDNDIVLSTTAYYRLEEDFDLSVVCSMEKDISWRPIGNASSPFMGQFDGNGHTISNLFIDVVKQINSGFFGFLGDNGVIKNLTVEGVVGKEGYQSWDTGTSASAALVVGQTGDQSLVDHCVSKGTVRGVWRYSGGIIGSSDGGYVENCTNYASVGQSYECGGIIGTTFPYGIINCINYGTISGERAGGMASSGNGPTYGCVNYGEVISGVDYAGGIIGWHNSRDIYNCQNFGTVTSNFDGAGGITGFSVQSGRVINCINMGTVKGAGKPSGVGGITANVGSFWANQSSTSVLNSVNTGNVVLSDSAGEVQYLGGVAGYVAPKTEGTNVSIVKHSYWLYDPDKGLGIQNGIGLNEGTVSNIFALTDAEIKGAECQTVLYGSYNRLVDALNAWAAEHVSTTKTPLYGWVLDEETGQYSFTGIDALPPGSTQGVFRISEKKFNLGATGGDVVVIVTATMDYTLTHSDWIIEGPSEQISTYDKRFEFSVASYDGDGPRSGEIIFTNTLGATLKVTVKQKAPYLKVSEDEVILSAEGASRRVIISGNIAWEASSNADWCKVSPDRGSGDATVSIQAFANEQSRARSAQVTVSSTDGKFVFKIPVIQSGRTAQDQGNWKELPFHHQSVAMRFTATWCGYCPIMSKSIQMAQEMAPDKILHLAIHGGDSDLEFEKCSVLEGQYGIYAFPSGIVDGRVLIENNDPSITAPLFVKAANETEEKYGTVTGIDINSSISGSSASIDLNAYVKESGDYKITVLLVEDGIVNKQSDYIDGDHPSYIHDNIARVAVTNVLGEDFSISEAYSVKPFHYTVQIPEVCNKQNLRVFAYIQAKYGSRQVIQSSSSYGEYYVDNAATVMLGAKLGLALEGSGSSSGGGQGGGNEGITPGDDIDM